MKRTHLDQPFPSSILYLALGLFILEFAAVVAAPVPWLLANANADDFYYYLVLARNTTSGAGPSFDGLELTNGFHPLYLLLLTALAHFPAESPEFLIKAGLGLLLLFHNATGLVIAGGFWLQQRPEVGIVAAVVWLLNPWALAITLNGVEAPLATFLWATIIFLVMANRQSGTTGYSQAVGLGCLIGLAILARTDGLLLWAALLLTELYRIWPGHGRGKRLLQLLTSVGVVLLITMPWWWWNLTHFGTIMQVSGKAIFITTHGFDWRHPDIIATNVFDVGLKYFSRILLFSAMPLLMMLFALWLHRHQGPIDRQALWPVFSQLDFAWLGLLFLAGWYCIWQWSVQNWYLHSSVMVVTIGMGMLYRQLFQGDILLPLKPAVGLAIYTSLLLLVAGYLIVGFGYPRQERGYYLAQWLNHNTKPEAVIGSWNSGIVAYFARRTVINLDGVVNNSVYHYKVERQVSGVGGLMDYVRLRNIDYLTDYEFFFVGEPAALGLDQAIELPEHGLRVYPVIKAQVDK